MRKIPNSKFQIPNKTQKTKNKLVRLDSYFRKTYPHVTRRELLKFFREKKILVGGRPAAKSDPVTGGENFTLPPEFFRTERSLAPNPELGVKIIHEDDAILVVSKPAGMPSVAHSYDETGTLANFLIAHDPKLAGVGDKPLEPGMVHRLDTETSGLMVVAKTAEAFANLKGQFKERKVLKEYRTLVEGVVKEGGEITAPIGTNPKNIRKVKVFAERQIPPGPPLAKGGRGDLIKGAQEAVTKYRVEKTYPEKTLLRVQIITGVRHQIRAHLAYLGHPVVGDGLYGSKLKARRLCLHAVGLGFVHPVTGEWVEFEDAPQNGTDPENFGVDPA
ncbi:MAG: RluA family pseudouridine synthase [Deltaproteobacteria bacterium]|nr:RluA family pseudouridine synthase [Deltaproteobacteria bacterium]